MVRAGRWRGHVRIDRGTRGPCRTGGCRPPSHRGQAGSKRRHPDPRRAGLPSVRPVVAPFGFRLTASVDAPRSVIPGNATGARATWRRRASRPPDCRAPRASTACRSLRPGTGSEVLKKAGPEAEAPGSVARRAHAPEDYAARRISMPTLSLAFRVLVRCSERGLPAPNRSSPYRKPHLTLPKQDRTRDPFTVQSNLFRPQQKHPGSARPGIPGARLAPERSRGRMLLVEAPGTAPGS